MAGAEVVTFAAGVAAWPKDRGRLAEGKEISEMIGMDVFERSLAEQDAIESGMAMVPAQQETEDRTFGNSGTCPYEMSRGEPYKNQKRD